MHKKFNNRAMTNYATNVLLNTVNKHVDRLYGKKWQYASFKKSQSLEYTVIKKISF